MHFSTNPGGGPVEVRWDGVPSANLDWRVGPDSVITGALRIVLRNLESGGSSAAPGVTVLKAVYVPAAEFTLPGFGSAGSRSSTS